MYFLTTMSCLLAHFLNAYTAVTIILTMMHNPLLVSRLWILMRIHCPLPPPGLWTSQYPACLHGMQRLLRRSTQHHPSRQQLILPLGLIHLGRPQMVLPPR